MTGRSFSGTGWRPHLGQVTIGIGVPQARWREISQSLRRKRTTCVAFPALASFPVMAWRAFTESIPSNSPEFTKTPSSSNARPSPLGGGVPAGDGGGDTGVITVLIG